MGTSSSKHTYFRPRLAAAHAAAVLADLAPASAIAATTSDVTPAPAATSFLRVWTIMANGRYLPKNAWALNKQMHTDVKPAIKLTVSHGGLPSQTCMAGILLTKNVEQFVLQAKRGVVADALQVLSAVKDSPHWATRISALMLDGPGLVPQALPLPPRLKLLLVDNMEDEDCAAAALAQLPPGLTELHVQASGGGHVSYRKTREWKLQPYPALQLPRGLCKLIVYSMRLEGQELVLPTSLRTFQLDYTTWVDGFRLIQYGAGDGSNSANVLSPLTIVINNENDDGDLGIDSNSLLSLPPTVTDLTIVGNYTTMFEGGNVPAQLVRLDMSNTTRFNEPMRDLPPGLQQPAQRKKLEALQKREMIKEKAARQSATLVKTLVAQYGTRHEHAVEAAVADLFKRQLQPSAADLAELEAHVKGMYGHMGGSAGDARGGSAGASADDLARDWRAFDMAKQIEFEDTQARKKMRAALEQARLRHQLSGQVRDHMSREQQAALERQAELDAQAERRRQWDAEQAAARAKIQERHAEERRIRQQQIDAARARAEAERADAERHERVALAKVAEQAADEDARLMEEYRLRLDREEAERARKLKERMQKYEKIGAYWQDSGNVREQAAELDRLEANIQEEFAARAHAESERERRDWEKRRIGCMAAALDNRRTVQERNRRSEEEAERERQLAETARADAEAFKQAEKERIEKKRLAMTKYRAELDKQASASSRKKKEVDMTETEALLNSDIVKRIQADARLQQRVRERLGAAY
ncbi:hypothetical protein JKP88DRAFT_261750 [Tribonema minus]|uniref:Uncharacterized protein n=1 Tax=Tribonema minus TaxID=303371 RepID=A0A836CRB1_9STRA|nr:hypothetical protein JKP88DRAFT_261750 [Tribonema minus]